MSYSRFIIPVLAMTVVLSACKKDPPPPPAPVQEEPDMIDQDSLLRAQQLADSIAAAEAAARAAEERRREAIRNAVQTLEEMVFFDYDESELTSAAQTTLRSKVDILRASPAVRIRVEGHADERGSTEYNVALSSRRADAVREFLVGFGLDQSRFSILALGEDDPLVNASNEAAWARNRRAEFVITAGADQINPPGFGR